MKFKFYLLLTVFLLALAPIGLLAVDNTNTASGIILGATDVKSPTDLNITASNDIVNLYFFYSLTCPHCHDEALFLGKLKNELGEKLKIYSFELTENYGNIELYEKFGRAFAINLNQLPTPGTFIGEKSLIGYGNDEYDGANIKNLIEQCLKLGCHDLGAEIINQNQEQGSGTENKTMSIAVGVAVIIGVVIIILVRRKNQYKNL